MKFWLQQERQWSNNDAMMQGLKDSVVAGAKILNKQYLECRIEGFYESAMMRFEKLPEKTLDETRPRGRQFQAVSRQK